VCMNIIGLFHSQSFLSLSVMSHCTHKYTGQLALDVSMLVAKSLLFVCIKLFNGDHQETTSNNSFGVGTDDDHFFVQLCVAILVC